MFKGLFGKREKFTSANIVEFIDKAIGDLQEEFNEALVEEDKIREREQRLLEERVANQNHKNKVTTMMNKINKMFTEEN
ncbi:MAG: hypothetical protein ACRCX2_20475 [Paraclostridium sp.]